MVSRRRALVADTVGLLAILLLLVDYLSSSLLLLPTITAGGDTPCHYPTLVWFYQRLLPNLRLHGWYPGAYAGQPLLLYYFPLPFLVMSAFAPLAGLPVAFKLGTVLGVFLLPLFAFVSLRLMGFGFPAPLLGAAAAVVFLFLEENPIWGGTLASTLTGEFSYTYGIGLAVLFLGVLYRAYSKGRGPWLPAAVLGITALAHGYAVLWAGFAAVFFLYSARRPWKTLGWLAAVALLAFALAGVSLLPLLADWGWTTPYDDPWITVTTRSLVPSMLWPLVVLAVAGLLGTLLWARRTGGPDHRLLFLLHAALAGAALAASAPALGVIDVRFVPFAQLALCLGGGTALGLAARRLEAPDLAALGLVLAAALYADSRSQYLRSWIEWNYSGLEAKELWPAFRDMTRSLRGSVADPRVAVEYSAEHEKAGSIRMYEMLPFFTGRSTLEGVYNQASLQTHFVYFLASELGEKSPNPFRSREYSLFDTEAALRHLRLYNVSDIVALSPKLVAALEARTDVSLAARIPPYSIFHLAGSDGRYVEPLAYAPARAPRRGWRDRAYAWFARKAGSVVPVVFTDDPAFKAPLADPWVEPDRVPLPSGAIVHERIEAERIDIETSAVGHPLLVKVSYHPRWRAEGADGPYLVSPALMMIVPRQSHVRLVYARTWADGAGAVLSLAGVALCIGGALRGRPAPAAAVAPPRLDACALPPPPRRWGWVVPVALLGALTVARFIATREGPSASRATALSEDASKAFAAERFAEAADRAGRALELGVPSDRRGELLCLRGESLLKEGRPQDAAKAFDALLQESPGGPYAAQALYGAIRAKKDAGNEDGASLERHRLETEFGDTPWARRLKSDGRP
ncbi:MAG: 6-pyruvoyl-tetrahydropterin synthase-related protein [Vicinamibacteria bacterium]